MNFFKLLNDIGAGIDITLKIKEKNGKLTVMVMPEKGNTTRVYGKVITSAPEELDNEFFAAIQNPPAVSEGTTVHDLPIKPETPSKAAEPKNESKSTVKKGNPKKDTKVKKTTRQKPAPVIQERSMFDQPAAPGAADQSEQPVDEEADETADNDDQTDSETE